MKYFHRKLLLLFMVTLIGGVWVSFVQAQEASYRIAYTEIFGKLRRPAIDFNHEAHTDALEDAGCGACHHAPDEKTGALVYVQDEEISCSECHGPKKEGSTPALREAFHGSCTPCHRKMIKKQNAFKGPTTCGECHTPAN